MLLTEGSFHATTRHVTCAVYEDTILILKGYLVVSSVDVDNNGNISYNSIITGCLIGFKTALGNSVLTDLDLSELKHTYNIDNILSSQGPSNTSYLPYIEVFDKTANAHTNQFYQLGRGYIYGFIDYGYVNKNADYNTSYAYNNIKNFQPGIWVNEYVARIFNSVGYTFEINDTSTFKDFWKRLIIPSSSGTLTYTSTDHRAVMTTTTTTDQDFNWVLKSSTDELYSYPVKWTAISDNYLLDYGPAYGSGPSGNRTQNILVCKRTFTSDARIQVSGSYQNDLPAGFDDTFSIQLVKRDFLTDVDLTTWTVLAEQRVTIPENSSKPYVPFSVDMILQQTDFTTSEQLQVRLLQNTGASGVIYSKFNITSATLQFSKDATSAITVNVEVGDYITPAAPTGIKQIDFLKGLFSLFNIYCYTDNSNPSHFHLSTYDYYYAYANAATIKTTALDWSNKVDLSKGIKITNNTTIPKNYLFSFKDDSDYFNDTYKKKWNETYSQLAFDGIGYADQKTITLPFSPSPMMAISGTYRMYPLFAKNGSSIDTKQPSNVNIRILYFNDLHACAQYQIGDDSLNLSTGEWTFNTLSTLDNYALVSNYIFDPASRYLNTPNDSDGNPSALVPISDLHFSSPREFYFLADDNYLDVSTSFQYYQNQIAELIDANLIIIDIDIHLTETDINQIDLRIPVFLNLPNGYGYFKILSINYSSNKNTSTVKLQKIVL
ncbi:hypothetical protein DCC81_19255 [Chitinophaga parva]|uniref:Uncharacterized protein n=1 Tax=Chitinophaga parva TaxID=2169414 RepID=A0A2T7BJ90_9BACT|nr:hypothetical protein [Chitinophaga parva]PUZ26359.1 hypothetical protein DCC81_19255 [Chitinophaga parva]